MHQGGQGEIVSEGSGGLEDLQRLVEEFIMDLKASIKAFTGESYEFSANALTDGGLSIRLEQCNQQAGIIPLTWNGFTILGVRPSFKCTWDSTRSFLAVDQSSFSVHPAARSNSEPLFRVEYDRNKTSYPSSHFHVHAHRDEMTHLLGLTKKLNTAKEKKVRDFISNIPALSNFHFPTGGHRFRPCLEDVLEALRQEFNLDIAEANTWEEQLAHARLKWRKIQIAAAVRDSPDVALQVLVDELGMPIPAGWECPSGDVSKIVRD